MREPIANPPRLSGLSEGEDSFEVGRLFREARALPDEEFPRLRWRLRTSQQLRTVRSRIFLKVALVVGVAFCMGGIVGAVVSPFSGRKTPAAIFGPSPLAAPSAGHHKRRTVDLPAPDAPATLIVVPPVVDAQAAAFVPRQKARTGTRIALLGQALPSAGPRNVDLPTPSGASSQAPEFPLPAITPPAAAWPTVASPIAVEQTLLGQAIRTLRAEHDARTALALLTQHQERFPQGTFTSEARMLRIEALLALGQRDDALAILDRTSLASLPNPDEQRVVRGELRAARQRWREAAQDFDDALRERAWSVASPKVRGIQERALWGRAAARSRLGDQEGARADLQLYLRYFPGGQFAGATAALLKGTR